MEDKSLNVSLKVRANTPSGCHFECVLLCVQQVCLWTDD
jgi:hypothetical protein